MEKGLSTTDIAVLRKQYGHNIITTQKPLSPLAIFLSQYPTIINGILFLAAFFSFVIGDMLDAGVILTILLLNGIVGFIQEYNAEKALERLTQYLTPLSLVIRDGEKKQIPTIDLLPGDIVVLSEGDRIPADGIFLHNEDLEVDESILTGEVLPVVKEKDTKGLGGTVVVKGKGHMKIEKIGMETKFGQIAVKLSTLLPDTSPLKVKLNELSRILSLIAIIAALSVIPIGIAQGRAFFPLVLLAISILVAAIPQSLPTVITISLAVGTARMAAKNAIVRKMQAVETLGATQMLLVDKTGTLTENAMRVKMYWVNDKKHLLSLLRACVFGNSATLIQKGSGKGTEIIGDQTDGALLLWAKSMTAIEKIHENGSVTDEFVFDPEEKTITTVWKQNHTVSIFVRGAPEAIIAKSTLSEKEKEQLTKHYETLALTGLRVIGFGMKHETHEHMEKRDHLENHLTFLGFVGIYDPPRDEVTQAIAKAKNAGITTIMVTGDNEKTALAIAKEIGLLEENEDVITGEQLETITDEQLESLIDHTRVFARSTPEDKLRLVTILKKKGYIVAVTGDGVNDALALKRSDVGVAMGQSGTDVAKEAADIILTDDNFATLVSAISEGRIIYHNILKAITYLLCANISEMTLIVIATLLGFPPPVLPTQLLWINLITDGLPALALASDIKDPELLLDKPRDPKAPILTRERLIFINIVGILLGLTLLSVFIISSSFTSDVFARTIMFNLMTFAHLSLAFIVRGKYAFKPNPLLMWGTLGIILLQLLITLSPLGQSIFSLSFH